MKLTVLLFGLLLVATCNHDQTTAPQSTQENRVMELRLKSNELRVEGPYVIFEPDRHVKRSSYNSYRFDLENFKNKIGDPNLFEGSMLVSIKVKEKQSQIHEPNDPGQSAPQGGFRFHLYISEILSITNPWLFESMADISQTQQSE